MKKFYLIALSFVFLLIGSVGLVACKNSRLNQTITPGEAVTLSGSEQAFSNQSDFKLSYKGNNTYKAEGTTNSMSQSQAKAWGTTEGTKYVVVHLDSDDNSIVKFGWKSQENKDSLLGEVDNNNIKQITLTEGEEDFILAIDKESTPYWRVEITKQDQSKNMIDNNQTENVTQTTDNKTNNSENIEVYIVDFSSLYKTSVNA